MSAKNGNRYAEKWTYESTMRALEKINFFAMQEETLYLGMALARAGYYDDIWRYWRKKWAHNYEIIHEMKQLMQLFEARLFTRAAMGKMPVSLSMFALRHHYGWGREQQAQEDLGYLVAEDKHLSQTLSEGEGCDTADVGPVKEADEAVCDEVREVVAEAPAAGVASAARDAHRSKLTPDEVLLAEAGVSSIAEIERRMREEDPDLAEFDDMDEDIEWEVVTPQTYRP